MDVIEISKKIEEKILLLEKGREILKERAELKAYAISHYEKTLAITIIKLRNNVPMELEGQKIDKLPTTIIEKTAKGICWREKLDLEKKEAEYRSAVIGMDSIKAELNGYQSVNRYLDEK